MWVHVAEAFEWVDFIGTSNCSELVVGADDVVVALLVTSKRWNRDFFCLMLGSTNGSRDDQPSRHTLLVQANCAIIVDYQHLVQFAWMPQTT